MPDVVIAVLLFSGSLFSLVASVGLLRMPDLFMRMSATTKAATLGTALILAAVALYFASPGVTGLVIAIAAFIILTAPVAAHMIARAAYFTGVPLWKQSIYDDLRQAIDEVKGEKNREANDND